MSAPFYHNKCGACLVIQMAEAAPVEDSVGVCGKEVCTFTDSTPRTCGRICILCVLILEREVRWSLPLLLKLDLPLQLASLPLWHACRLCNRTLLNNFLIWLCVVTVLRVCLIVCARQGFYVMAQPMGRKTAGDSRQSWRMRTVLCYNVCTSVIGCAQTQACVWLTEKETESGVSLTTWRPFLVFSKPNWKHRRWGCDVILSVRLTFIRIPHHPPCSLGVLVEAESIFPSFFSYLVFIARPCAAPYGSRRPLPFF